KWRATSGADHHRILVSEEPRFRGEVLTVLSSREQSLFVGDVAPGRDAHTVVHTQLGIQRGEHAVDQIVAGLLEVPLRAEADEALEVLARLHHLRELHPAERLPVVVLVEEVLPHLRPHALEQVAQPAQYGVRAEYRMLSLFAVE